MPSDQVTIRQADEKQIATKGGGKRRSLNGTIGFRVPKEVVEEKCQSYMRYGKAAHRHELEKESDFTIVMHYQLVYRGIAEYYRLAFNMHTLSKLKWVMEQSLTMTLAAKLKRSVPKIYAKYRADLVVDGKKYRGLQVIIPRQDKNPLVATWGGVSLSWNIKATLEEKPSKIYNTGHSELVQRLLADTCEMCGSTHKIEVHHIRAMKHLHEHPGRPKPEWVKRMIALKRKTLILCRTCHEDVQYGRPMRRQTIEFEEVKALRKDAMTTILESRVH